MRKYQYVMSLAVIVLCFSCSGGATSANSGGDGAAPVASSSYVDTDSSKLAEANPGIQFESLAVGDRISLQAPYPSADSPSTLLYNVLPDDCICSWTKSNWYLLNFDDENGCPTNATILTEGSGSITVTVECEIGTGIYSQDISIQASEDGETAAATDSPAVDNSDQSGDGTTSGAAPAEEDSPLCSVSYITQSSDSRYIINGENCDESNHPVVMIFIFDNAGNLSSCTGTFITQKEILTAAHCVYAPSFASIVVYYNDEFIEATGYSYSPYYNEEYIDYFDIGVINLPEEVAVTPLPIVVSRTPVANETIRVFGYGMNEQDLTSPEAAVSDMELEVGEMNVYTWDNYGFLAVPNDEHQITCSGDSGGPALVQTEGQWGILGVTSSVDTDCSQIGFFPNVKSYYNQLYLYTMVPDITIL